MKIFISGANRGLGRALAKASVAMGHQVYALGRSNPQITGVEFTPCDLSQHQDIPGALEAFSNKTWDLAILNAGVIGPMQSMRECSIESIAKVMDVNVWANKILLDELLKGPCHQVIGISSGASVNGSKGWSSYSLSKSTLNMLLQLYAADFPDCHFTSLAPGLVSTDMLNGLIENEPADKFPSLVRLKESAKQTPDEAASNIISLLNRLKTLPSGSFQDVRNLLGDEAF